MLGTGFDSTKRTWFLSMEMSVAVCEFSPERRKCPSQGFREMKLSSKCFETVRKKGWKRWLKLLRAQLVGSHCGKLTHPSHSRFVFNTGEAGASYLMFRRERS